MSAFAIPLSTPPSSQSHIELAKGKHSVECDSVEGLVKVLAVIKSAVEAGELDTQIAMASVTLRKGFNK